MRLTEKTAFVTGGGGGLGQEICRKLVANGAHVAVVDISREKAEETAELITANPVMGGGKVIAIACDITRSDEVRAATEQVKRAFGAINVLVNNAGGSTLNDGAVTVAPEEEFWRAINLDLFGTFLCCKHVIPEIAAAGGGAVINMSSIAALVGLPGRDCYTAAKGGVTAMTRSMAVEYAPEKIRVNAIAPSVTVTARSASLLEQNPHIQALASRHLLGLGAPHDVADLAVYLASEEARIITGHIFPVDSGCSIH
jgi:NAD(P)-dependent dehydrogenase (short-subunit alcohol dehydrogenase family)